jgi:hypothetical protein
MCTAARRRAANCRSGSGTMDSPRYRAPRSSTTRPAWADSQWARAHSWIRRRCPVHAANASRRSADISPAPGCINTGGRRAQTGRGVLEAWLDQIARELMPKAPPTALALFQAFIEATLCSSSAPTIRTRGRRCRSLRLPVLAAGRCQMRDTSRRMAGPGHRLDRCRCLRCA